MAKKKTMAESTDRELLEAIFKRLDRIDDALAGIKDKIPEDLEEILGDAIELSEGSEIRRTLDNFEYYVRRKLDG
jgi:hypothetical protein